MNEKQESNKININLDSGIYTNILEITYKQKGFLKNYYIFDKESEKNNG